jgi:uncharacterized protein YndB with AHSA1/START domain
MNVEPIRNYIEPLRKTIEVACPPELAFEIFTARIHTWWPLATHSIGQERARTCAIEPRVGGRVYEVHDDGRAVWGTVLAFEPPSRLLVTWHPGREPGTAQEVEVRFVPSAHGTRVELEHRNWQAYGRDAAEAREGYDNGWQGVLHDHFAAACLREAHG